MTIALPLALSNDLAAQFAAQGGAAWWAGGGNYEGKLGPWSTLSLDGRVFPGVSGYDDPRAWGLISISGNVNYRIDPQKVKGSSGHRLNVEGYTPTPLQITMRCWNAPQWAAYTAYLSQISPKVKTNKLRRYRVLTPILAAYQISEIFIHDISLPKDAQDRFVHDVTLTVLEVWDLHPGTGAKTIKQANLNDTAVLVDARFFRADPDKLTGGSSTPATGGASILTPQQTRAQQALGLNQNSSSYPTITERAQSPGAFQYQLGPR